MTPYRTSFRVRVYEAGPGGFAGPEVLANYLQESAASHADLLDVGAEPMAAEGLAWILTRLRLTLTRTPRLGELLSVETWPARLDKRLALRAWRLADAEGAMVAVAIAHWGVFDILRRRLTSFPTWLMERVEAGAPAPIDFTRRSLPALTSASEEMRLFPRRAELDVNGHVNNARLLGWLLEPLPEMPDRRLIEIDTAFRGECRLGEAVLSRAGSEAGGLWHHALVREIDGTDLVRAISRWA
ncbi:acyl-[acyl-carrier-protein] thioesterase [Algihabitans albus]|uniref:acyl-[acyl-carrier-protein] thioesterase n=1 Tax=Algihabitans albus TaxID=2164067 RepID=UPI0013C30A86|nr:acyl-ACP thioesterase domain-containing protein [Algihabitans albus]